MHEAGLQTGQQNRPTYSPSSKATIRNYLMTVPLLNRHHFDEDGHLFEDTLLSIPFSRVKVGAEFI